jgi:hypothetical protein
MMHRLNHSLPSGEPLLTVEIRYSRITTSTDMTHASALSDNKSNTTLRPSAIIINYIIPRDIVIR